MSPLNVKETLGRIIHTPDLLLLLFLRGGDLVSIIDVLDPAPEEEDKGKDRADPYCDDQRQNDMNVDLQEGSDWEHFLVPSQEQGGHEADGEGHHRPEDLEDQVREPLLICGG